VGSLSAIRLGLDSLLSDEGTYDLYGRLVATGHIPYRDFEMPYSPLTAWFDGLVWLTGGGILGMRLALLAFSCACLALVAWLGRKLAGSWWWGLYGAAFWLAAQTVPKTWILYPQFQAAVLVVGGLLVLHPARRRWNRPGLAPVAAGALFGLAAGFKQTIGVYAFLGALLALGAASDYGRRAWLKPLFVTLVSILLLVLTHQLLLTAGTIVIWTVWITFVATSLRHSRLDLPARTTVMFVGGFAGICLGWLLTAFMISGPGSVANNLLSGAPIVRAYFVPLDTAPLVIVTLLVPPAWTLLAALPRISARSSDPLLLSATVGAAAGGLFDWFPRFDAPHLVAVLPVLVPLLPVVLLALWHQVVRPQFWIRRVELRAAGIFALGLVLLAPNLGSLHSKATTFVRIRAGTVQVPPLESAPGGILGPPDLAEELKATIQEVQAHAATGAIFTFPSAPAIYILAERPMATRQPYLYIFIEDLARQRETLRELESSRPQVVVVDTTSTGGPQGDVAFMRDWLRDEYVIVREGSRYTVYARR
jgi:hypothetical protein